MSPVSPLTLIKSDSDRIVGNLISYYEHSADRLSILFSRYNKLNVLTILLTVLVALISLGITTGFVSAPKVYAGISSAISILVTALQGYWSASKTAGQSATHQAICRLTKDAKSKSDQSWIELTTNTTLADPAKIAAATRFVKAARDAESEVHRLALSLNSLPAKLVMVDLGKDQSVRVEEPPPDAA